MNDSDDAYSLPAESVYDPVVPYDQLTDRLIGILWNNTPQLRMTSKLFDSRDDASSHRHGVCC